MFKKWKYLTDVLNESPKRLTKHFPVSSRWFPRSPTSPTWDSDIELLDLLKKEEMDGQFTVSEPIRLTQTSAAV